MTRSRSILRVFVKKKRSECLIDNRITYPVVFHQQLQIFDWLQCIGLEYSRLCFGVSHQILDGLANLEVSPVNVKALH